VYARSDTAARRSWGRIALNLDGGPIASQIVSAGGWQRTVHGNAEITEAGDVLRLAYQSAKARRREVVTLPTVLAGYASRDLRHCIHAHAFWPRRDGESPDQGSHTLCTLTP
jgi:hypothetical protein